MQSFPLVNITYNIIHTHTHTHIHMKLGYVHDKRIANSIDPRWRLDKNYQNLIRVMPINAIQNKRLFSLRTNESRVSNCLILCRNNPIVNDN